MLVSPMPPQWYSIGMSSSSSSEICGRNALWMLSRRLAAPLKDYPYRIEFVQPYSVVLI